MVMVLEAYTARAGLAFGLPQRQRDSLIDMDPTVHHGLDDRYVDIDITTFVWGEVEPSPGKNREVGTRIVERETGKHIATVYIDPDVAEGWAQNLSTCARLASSPKN